MNELALDKNCGDNENLWQFAYNLFKRKVTKIQKVIKYDQLVIVTTRLIRPNYKQSNSANSTIDHSQEILYLRKQGLHSSDLQ